MIGRVLDRRGLLGRLGLSLAAPAALTEFAAPARGQEAAQGRRLLSVRDLGARGDGSADDHAAITAGVDALRAHGGSLHFPAGTYAVSQPVQKPGLVRFVGEGARSSIIRAMGARARFATAVVTSVSGSAAAPGLLFSTGIAHLGIDAAGVADICLLVRGDQENCVYEDLILANFLAAGLKTAGLRETTHGAAFRDLHVIPNATGTRAARAIVLADTVKCTFENISTDKPNRADGGDGPYAIGIEIGPGSILNLFTAIHTEDALVGIDNQGPLNTFIALQAYTHYGSGIAHFRNSAVSYVLLNLQTRGTVADFRFHIQDKFGGDVAQALDRSTAVRLLQTEAGQPTLIGSQGPSQFSAPLAVGGLHQRARGGGAGLLTAVATGRIEPLQARALRVILEGVTGPSSWAGKVTLFAAGAQPGVVEAAFGLRLDGKGALVSQMLGPLAGMPGPALEIGPITPDPEARAGRFGLTLRNADPRLPAELTVRVELAGDAAAVSELSAELS
jgi:hypothetical protein